MRVLAAIAVSLAVHALVVFGIAAYMAHCPSSYDVLVELDLSGVELGISDEEEDAAPPVVSAPSASDEPAPSPVPKIEAIPQAETFDHDSPPEFNANRELPEPVEHSQIPEPTEAVKSSEPAEAYQSVAPSPIQARIDAPPKPKHTIKPKYPSESRKRGEQGSVGIEFIVSSDGSAKSLSVVSTSGFPLLDEAAINAVREARFTPAKSNGKTIDFPTRIKLDFILK